MVKYDTVLIRFGELSTKGKNRKDFIQKLYLNIKKTFEDMDSFSFKKTHDRIYIDFEGDYQDLIRDRLVKVFGISSFSFTKKVNSNIEEIEETCLNIAKETTAKTFKMIAKRQDKTFPLKSDEINRRIASTILKNTDVKVDVHAPELPIRIEVQKELTYITTEKILGAGGYPAGMNGKVLLLLSGGIDSPVAAYELMKRGLKVEAIHFAAPPYTSENAKNKVLTLAKMLCEYQYDMKIHVIPFTKLQLDIYKHAGDPYAITLMRRMMFRIAEKVARSNNCLALGSGESVGQVASQTLESINAINDVIHIPVLRPLVCFDKVEIIDVAKKINTYETSILPFEDCCTIFDPKNPVTKPSIEKCEYYEAKFNYEEMIEEAINDQEIKLVEFKREKEDYL